MPAKKKPQRSRRPRSAIPPAAPRPDPVYAISLGDLHKDGVGAVLRISAPSEEEAVARAKKLANSFYDGTDLLKIFGADVPGADSLRIYLDGAPISARHIEDIEEPWSGSY